MIIHYSYFIHQKITIYATIIIPSHPHFPHQQLPKFPAGRVHGRARPGRCSAVAPCPDHVLHRERHRVWSPPWRCSPHHRTDRTGRPGGASTRGTWSGCWKIWCIGLMKMCRSNRRFYDFQDFSDVETSPKPMTDPWIRMLYIYMLTYDWVFCWWWPCDTMIMAYGSFMAIPSFSVCINHVFPSKSETSRWPKFFSMWPRLGAKWRNSPFSLSCYTFSLRLFFPQLRSLWWSLEKKTSQIF